MSIKEFLGRAGLTGLIVFCVFLFLGWTGVFDIGWPAAKTILITSILCFPLGLLFSLWDGSDN